MHFFLTNASKLSLRTFLTPNFGFKYVYYKKKPTKKPTTKKQTTTKQIAAIKRIQVLQSPRNLAEVISQNTSLPQIFLDLKNTIIPQFKIQSFH